MVALNVPHLGVLANNTTFWVDSECTARLTTAVPASLLSIDSIRVGQSSGCPPVVEVDVEPEVDVVVVSADVVVVVVSADVVVVVVSADVVVVVVSSVVVAVVVSALVVVVVVESELKHPRISTCGTCPTNGVTSFPKLGVV